MNWTNWTPVHKQDFMANNRMCRTPNFYFFPISSSHMYSFKTFCYCNVGIRTAHNYCSFFVYQGVCKSYLMVLCPSVFLFYLSTTTAACGGFAAVGPAGRRYQLLHVRRSAATASCDTLSADVESWTQTCPVLRYMAIHCVCVRVCVCVCVCVRVCVCCVCVCIKAVKWIQFCIKDFHLICNFIRYRILFLKFITIIKIRKNSAHFLKFIKFAFSVYDIT